MKVGVHQSSRINVFVSLNIYPGVEWLPLMEVLFFFFNLYNSLEMTDYGAGKQMKGYQELRGGSGCGHEISLG